MMETIPEMRARHRREINAALERLASQRITQTEAAQAQGMPLSRFNSTLVRAGIVWPVKRQGRPRQVQS